MYLVGKTWYKVHLGGTDMVGLAQSPSIYCCYFKVFVPKGDMINGKRFDYYDSKAELNCLKAEKFWEYLFYLLANIL